MESLVVVVNLAENIKLSVRPREGVFLVSGRLDIGNLLILP